MKQMVTAWLLGLLCLSTLLTPSPGVAQEVKRVVVLDFSGKGAAIARSAAVSALEERSDVELVSVKQAEAARQRLGGSWVNAQTYRDVAAELGVAAFVEGSVQKAGSRFRATLRVRDGSSGVVSKEEDWTRKALPQLKAISGNFWLVFGQVIRAATQPSVKSAPAETALNAHQEPEQPLAASAANVQPDEETEPRSSGRTTAHPALVVWAGPRLMWRNLSYDNPSTDLSSYRNPAGSPAVNAALGLRWFPGAHVRGDVLSDFGLEGEIDYAMGLKSEQAGKKFSTSAYELSAGALFRLPLESFEPVLRIGYVRHVFDADLPAGTPMPGVSYSALRFGLGAALFLADWLSLDVAASYLHVLDAGDLSTSAFAPNLSARAFEFSGGLVGYIKDAFGLRIAADFRRYAFDLGDNSNGSLMLAGAGADHYLRVTAAFVYRLGGVEKAR